METAKEINQYLNNISPYIEKIELAVKKQLEIDFNKNLELSNPNNKRYMRLNIMLANCTWFDSLLVGIHTNLKEILKEESK